MKIVFYVILIFVGLKNQIEHGEKLLVKKKKSEGIIVKYQKLEMNLFLDIQQSQSSSQPDSGKNWFWSQ